MKHSFKKSLLGKAISCMTVIAMIVTLLPAMFVFAEEITYEVKGDAVLFAPQSGNKSVVPFELVKKVSHGETVTSETISGAKLAFSGTVPAGVSLTSDKTAIVLDGTAIKNGSFTVIAEKNGVQASKEVTVADARFYFDFEGQTVDNTVTIKPKKLSDGTDLSEIFWNKGTIIADGFSGNGVKTNLTYLKPENAYNDYKKAKNVTIEFYAKKNSNADSFFLETGGSGVQMKSQNTVNSGRVSCTNSDGTFADTGLSMSTTTGWHKFQVVFDFNTGYYKVYNALNNTLLGTYTMLNSTGYAKEFAFRACNIDNVAIYSGVPFTSCVATGEILGNDELLAPIEGVKSVVKYVLSNGGAQIDNAVWTLNGAPAGITISNAGVLTMDGTAMNAGGSFTVNAVSGDGLLSATKEVKVNDYRYFDNFNSQTAGDNAQFNKIKLVDDTVTKAGIYFNNAPAIESDGTNNYLVKNANSTIQAVVKGDSTSNAWKEPNVVTMSFKVKNGGNAINLNGSPVLYIATTGRIGKSASEVTDAYIPVDEWAEICLTMDFNKKLYSVWADDCLALKDVAIPVTKRANDNYHGINIVDFYLSIDDLAIYSGEKIRENSEYVDGIVYQDNALKNEGTHSVKVIRKGVSLEDNIPTLIIAEYNGNILENVQMVKLSAGILGEYTLAGRLDNVETGHIVRAFLWNMKTLVPISVESNLD